VSALPFRRTSDADHASPVLYGCAFVVYVFSVIPSKHHIPTPHPPSKQSYSLDLTEHFSAPLPSSHKTTFPVELRAPTLELASSHLVCSVALTGVLVLQAGRWWAEGEDESVVRTTATSSVNVRRRKRSGTPPVEVPEPGSNRGSLRRKDGSIRRKRLGSTSSARRSSVL
jgi:ER membrane protein SH3